MNVVDKTKAGNPPHAIDFERFRLRRFVEGLGADECDTRNEPVDLAGVADILEGNSKAVLFRAAGPEKQELVGSVMGGRVRLAAGITPE